MKLETISKEIQTLEQLLELQSNVQHDMLVDRTIFPEINVSREKLAKLKSHHKQLVLEKDMLDRQKRMNSLQEKSSLDFSILDKYRQFGKKRRVVSTYTQGNSSVTVNDTTEIRGAGDDTPGFLIKFRLSTAYQAIRKQEREASRPPLQLKPTLIKKNKNFERNELYFNHKEQKWKLRPKAPAAAGPTRGRRNLTPTKDTFLSMSQLPMGSGSKSTHDSTNKRDESEEFQTQDGTINTLTRGGLASSVSCKTPTSSVIKLRRARSATSLKSLGSNPAGDQDQNLMTFSDGQICTADTTDNVDMAIDGGAYIGEEKRPEEQELSGGGTPTFCTAGTMTPACCTAGEVTLRSSKAGRGTPGSSKTVTVTPEFNSTAARVVPASSSIGSVTPAPSTAGSTSVYSMDSVTSCSAHSVSADIVLSLATDPSEQSLTHTNILPTVSDKACPMGSNLLERKQRCRRKSSGDSRLEGKDKSPELQTTQKGADATTVDDMRPGCRYFYNLYGCRAVTSPEQLQRICGADVVIGIIDVYDDHSDVCQAGQTGCRYCELQPRRRIQRWLQSLETGRTTGIYGAGKTHFKRDLTSLGRKHKAKKAFINILDPIEEVLIKSGT